MDRESINKYIHGSHRKAILKAQEVMRSQEDQDRLVPERQQQQRKGTTGHYVVPKFDRSIEKDMLRQQTAKKYGYEVNAAGFQEFEEVETFTVHPAVFNFHSLGDTMTKVYGNVPVEVSVKKADEVKAPQIAGMLKRQAEFKGKKPAAQFREWVTINGRQQGLGMAILVMEELNLIPHEEQFAQKNYNFNAGAITGMFGTQIL